MADKITFLGGAGTVTGSKYLVESGNKRVLIDCGLFQGFKQLRLRNWKPLPVSPSDIDAVLLTHAHIDHSGYLPLLVKNGFRGDIHCTEPTRALCEILLPDSGHLQEREAEFANRKGFSRHKPALPLYTQDDSYRCLQHFRTHPFSEAIEIIEGVEAVFREAGHILGAASIEMQTSDNLIVFSGDLGRYGTPIMHDPAEIKQADYLLVESTYGDTTHTETDPEDVLEAILNRTFSRGGTVVIPSFAVGRAQTLLFHISRLIHSGRIPQVPVYLDSPMAINASELFVRFAKTHKLTRAEAEEACGVAEYVREGKDSQKLDQDQTPKIIISASGMATGGRILYHLKAFAPDSRNTILFAGYQAGGTRGAAMLAGATKIKIHGSYHPVRAEVQNLHMLSAHADSDEIMRWLGCFGRGPKETFIVHGEPVASDALRLRIAEELGWSVVMPEHGETRDLP
ncbi:MBL fold metallo-hydrolase [Henriciella mobilis]|uniref:MBL fold metallo-hydrolase RNA specificity domain-containing protein n=1 Tax=Henriciella mobilis TaxID=2305467 RepID=UPI000E671F1E|nr:MBL fold metallo-hydrolase [Henriciella mobilis]RIJ15345.1 MBL fold metallo-hydrolase [Henriciella mobilis]RIJ18809.1 MBL fold metallo-hydrolase [Henriciella mobilis]